MPTSREPGRAALSEQAGYSLRQLCAAGNGFAPGEMAGHRKVILHGRVYTMESRFVPMADYEALAAECERLRASRPVAP